MLIMTNEYNNNSDISFLSLTELTTHTLQLGPLTREAAKATVAQHLSLLKLISVLHEVLKFGLRFKYREVRKNKSRFDCNQIR